MKNKTNPKILKLLLQYKKTPENFLQSKYITF